MITKQKLNELIDEVQKGFLISNNIINRTEYPYYYNHPSVPKSLTTFKKRLQSYREQSAEAVAKQVELPLPNASHSTRNFSMGTFAHHLTVALTVSLAGIGDCGECSANLGLALIQAGFGNLAFIGIEFSEAKEGMEKKHSFIVANLPTLPHPSSNAPLSIYDLFKVLPKHTLIGDAFLGLTFSPDEIPDDFIRYINAYGGKATLIQCQHFYNVPSKSLMFGGYLTTAKKVAEELKLRRLLIEKNPDTLKEKIEDTTLVTLLKEKSKLSFFAVRDREYKVDAFVKLNTVEDRSIAKNLQHSLKGHGSFFNIKDQKEVFVLEGINLLDENPKLIKNIQNLFKK